ncbi:hypothetical protein B0H11DRAFT_2304690 [Mycena galericulata]|nr:hypothetical protein B0H11DRAFT_2304690 [Mycena galericulata]
MSKLHPKDPNLIVIQDVDRTPPANPLLMTETITKTPAPSAKVLSSLNTANSATQRVLVNRILFNDQRCFLTGSVSTEIQACHLITTIRTKNQDKINLKAQVEFVLSRQGFNGKRAFFLDSLVNSVALQVQWHGQLDKRGSFCVAVPFNQINEMIRFVTSSNVKWDIRAAKDPRAPRDLDTTVDPFVITKCVILVLRPHLFLPDNEPILINTERTLRARGGSPIPASAATSWAMYHLEAGSPFLVDESGQYLRELQVMSQRTTDDSLSIFSLLVNAHYKLQALPNTINPPDEIIEYRAAINTLFRLIFHVPGTLDNPGPSPLGSEPPSLPNSNQAAGTPTPPAAQSGAPHERMDLDTDSPSSTNNRGGSMVDEAEAGSGSEFESDSESESESDSEISRRHLALVQAFDGRLSDAERSTAIMVGLGMSTPMYQPMNPLLEEP